jgi:hypothetical protein
MYGDTYGYRTGLNAGMVEHVRGIVDYAWSKFGGLMPDHTVLDIGSNDGTLLGFWPETCNKIGIDPSARKFINFYQELSHCDVVFDFFSKRVYQSVTSRKAKIITSIAMFYDLDDPVGFARDVSECLDDDGIWVTEQSYFGSMVRQNAYDTICHEHLCYFSIADMAFIAAQAGLKIIDVSFNDCNGGSFRVAMCHERCKKYYGHVYLTDSFVVPQDLIRDNVAHHAEALGSFLAMLRRRGKRIKGLGASTKGNVLLHAIGATSNLIESIGEVNEYKFGRVTPGTNIPIVPESEVMDADYLLVLPWHFRRGIVNRCKDYLANGGKLIFPLPDIEIVG